MISIVIPVYNEENGVIASISEINNTLEGFIEYEIIVVDDGSTDKTLETIKSANLKYVTCLTHPENLGYGKSLFDGIVAAKYECIAIIDGDGSYPAEKLKEMYGYFQHYDMVVGARQGMEFTKGLIKFPARIFFKFLAEYASGRKVPDVNSGMRMFKKSIVLKFQDSLCAGFSFTTTLTLLFMLNHYYVKYIPIEYRKREGKSKVRHFRDTLRALQLIIEAFLYYNPIKLFLLIAGLNLIFGIVLGLSNNLFFQSQILTIVAALCVVSFIPVFCFGLLADQLRKIYNQRNDK